MSEAHTHPSRNDLEVQISRAMIHFEKEFMGRGPLESKAYLLDDLILVRLKGVLTMAERKLSESQSDRSAYLLKQVRNELLASGKPLLETVIQDIVGVRVQSIHADISTKTGERVFVFSLVQSPQLSTGGVNGKDARRRSSDSAAAEEPMNSAPHQEQDSLESKKCRSV